MFPYLPTLRVVTGVKRARLSNSRKTGMSRDSRCCLLPTLGRFEFVASSLQEPFEYRVLTPTLESGWETLSPFDPPALVQAKWTVSPPAYLKMDPFEHFGFGYLRAPEGSILQLELEVEKNPQRVGATIHVRNQTQPSQLKPRRFRLFERTPKRMGGPVEPD